MPPRDAEEALRLAESGRPQIVLMDIDLDGTSGLEVAQQIRVVLPSARFIYVSAHVYDRYIQEALDSDASGYVSKRDEFDVLKAAIGAVMAGQCYLSRQVLSRLVVCEDGVRADGPPQTRACTLTAREREILEDIARGLAKKNIAARRHLSVKTVDRHCANLMAKLDIHDRVELARYAIREGLVSV